MVQIAAFNGVNNVEEILVNAGGSMPHIPDGTYKGIIVASELKDSKTGGKFLALKLVITEGPHANTEFTERLNIVNSNATAVKIAYETLARIAKAAGFTTLPSDSTQLHNHPFMFKTTTEAGTEFLANDGTKQMGKDKSVIDSKSYTSIAGAMAPVASAYNANTAPAPTNGAAMPWHK